MHRRQQRGIGHLTLDGKPLRAQQRQQFGLFRFPPAPLIRLGPLVQQAQRDPLVNIRPQPPAGDRRHVMRRRTGHRIDRIPRRRTKPRRFPREP